MVNKSLIMALFKKENWRAVIAAIKTGAHIWLTGTPFKPRETSPDGFTGLFYGPVPGGGVDGTASPEAFVLSDVGHAALFRGWISAAPCTYDATKTSTATDDADSKLRLYLHCCPQLPQLTASDHAGASRVAQVRLRTAPTTVSIPAHIASLLRTKVAPLASLFDMQTGNAAGHVAAWSCPEPYVALTSNTSDTSRYAEPAGSHRTDAHYQFDLNYTQNLHFGGRVTAQLVFDLYNVTNNQTGHAIQNQAHLANYGTPRLYYDPRRFQFSMRLQF